MEDNIIDGRDIDEIWEKMDINMELHNAKLKEQQEKSKKEFKIKRKKKIERLTIKEAVKKISKKFGDVIKQLSRE